MLNPKRQLFFSVLVQLLASLQLGYAQSVELKQSVRELIVAAHSQVGKTTLYDGSYQKIPYPGGDLPLERGVCTDVIIRAFRAVKVDLQLLVHADMKKNFRSYPALWGLKAPDPNIDHRRVPNLMTYFKRQGKALKVTQSSSDYLPGDLVTWKLPSGVPHIGLVSDRLSDSRDRYLILHNIGAGTQLEDLLFEFEITGHFRYF